MNIIKEFNELKKLGLIVRQYQTEDQTYNIDQIVDNGESYSLTKSQYDYSGPYRISYKVVITPDFLKNVAEKHNIDQHVFKTTNIRAQDQTELFNVVHMIYALIFS